jgi:GNAT superfamily N-acetyltransferase
MGKLTFRVARESDFRQLAPWLIRLSQAPERHCLHTWSGESPEELRGRLLGHLFDCELLYYIALRDGDLVGAIGSEYDEELMRAWLHGPHALEEGWGSVAGDLYDMLYEAMRPGIKQWDSYLNIENTRGRRFYTERGFKEREGASYEFWLNCEERVTSGNERALPIGEGHVASFKLLYERQFPEAYYSPGRIIDMIGKSHHVFVIPDGDEVMGYVVAVVSENGETGELQFLGVRDECRGRGYGRRLILTAIDWLFDHAGVSRISLNVNQDLVGPRRLYESVGFKLRFKGIGLRKLRSTGGQ